MNNKISVNKKVIFTVLLILIIILITFLLIFGVVNGKINAFFDNFFKIISPITIGFIIAYLSNPIVIFFEKYIFNWISYFRLKRFLSILFTFLVILTFISIILIILVPSIINTLISFWDTYIVNYEQAIQNWIISINSTMDKFKFLHSVTRLDTSVCISWIETKFPWIIELSEGDISGVLPDVSSSISHNIGAIIEYCLSLGISVFNFIKNLFLGIFIAFYMLMSKERCKAYIRRLLNGFLSPSKVRAVVRFAKLVDRSFGGFIEGQFLDAIVVGILSFITFIIFKIPVPHLLATIIAITNVIPIFGPFIGGIPSAFIVLITAPEKTILFIALMIIIQQIDGNIICPQIIGNKINISSLATIIAIITMGGLFGVLGMVIGVPIFAVIIHIVNTYTMNALRKKGLHTSINEYYVGNTENLQNNRRPFKEKFKILINKTTKNNKIKNKEEK